MPVTPFHIGPGLLLKGLAPRWVSLSAFVLANVVIDAESVFNLLVGRWPVHAALHTLPGALAVGVLSGVAVGVAGRWRPPSAETAWDAGLAGGVVGGLAQTGLDAVMHADLRPLAPFSDANPWLGAVGLDALHLACVVAGALGLAAFWLRQWRAP